MNPTACLQCGVPFTVRRTGGQRKRFCSSVCRGKWHRTRRGDEESSPIAEPVVDQSFADRGRTLQNLYDRLMADVEEHGTLIPYGQDGGLKANPSVEVLRRVILELDRRTAEQAGPREEPVADPVEAALRSVS